jgi:hypothetical protein
MNRHALANAKPARSATEIAADIRANVEAIPTIGVPAFRARQRALWDEAQVSRALDEAVCAALLVAA